MTSSLKEVELQARENHVPIMLEDGMEFLLSYIREHPWIMKILECGTAVGWSAMKMAEVRQGITIDTLEADPAMAKQAVNNIRNEKLDDRIFVHLCDAALYQTNQYYDLFSSMPQNHSTGCIWNTFCRMHMPVRYLCSII